MAFMAGNIKSLLAIKIKARHDSYSDQFSRIFAAKMFVVASLVMGIDWFHDTVSCIIPKDTNLEKDYVHSACWITGFYVYPELEKVMKSSSYYGIPKHIQIDGFKNGTTKICQTADQSGDKKKSCVPLKQYFFAQYQWMPFFIGSLSLLFYLPYIMFRIVNTDFISLKNDLETPETVRLGFFRRGLTKSPVNIKDGELYNNS